MRKMVLSLLAAAIGSFQASHAVAGLTCPVRPSETVIVDSCTGRAAAVVKCEGVRSQIQVHFHNAVDMATGKGGWAGHVLVLGDSHSQQYPDAMAAQVFLTTPDDVANLGINGAAVGEEWHLYFDRGVDTGPRRGLDGVANSAHPDRVISLANVNAVLLISNGANSEFHTQFAGGYIGHQEYQMLRNVIQQIKAANGGAPVNLYTTRNIESGFYYDCTTGAGGTVNIRQLSDAIDAVRAKKLPNVIAIKDNFDPGSGHVGDPGTDPPNDPTDANGGEDGYYWILDKHIHYQPAFYRDYVTCQLASVISGAQLPGCTLPPEEQASQAGLDPSPARDGSSIESADPPGCSASLCAGRGGEPNGLEGPTQRSRRQRLGAGAGFTGLSSAAVVRQPS